MGLFSMMLEEEIDKLVFPPRKWTAACDEIIARFEGGQSMSSDPQSLKQAMGQTAKAAIALGKLDKELKAAGCPSNPGNGNFDGPTEILADGGGPAL